MVSPSIRNTNYRATWVYHDLFHGGCAPVANRYGEEPYRPIRLRRNVRLIPRVFFPSVFLVAEQSIARRLAEYPHVDLNPCVWDAVYDYPISEDSVLSLLELPAGRPSQ
jgi:hypothetical protein